MEIFSLSNNDNDVHSVNIRNKITVASVKTVIAYSGNITNLK